MKAIHRLGYRLPSPAAIAAACVLAGHAWAQGTDRPAPHLLGLPSLPPVPVVYQSSIRPPGSLDMPSPAAAFAVVPTGTLATGPARTGMGIAAAPVRDEVRRRCGFASVEELRRNPRPGELRCLFDVTGPGAFGLLSYLDVPVYQPRTPMPGSHVVGIPGLPTPLPGESYEQWEWRTLRTQFGPETRTVHRDIESLDPVVASKILRLETRLRQEGIRFSRRETWRAPERQAFLFQQGRSRPGSLATATLTSWHSRVDRLGRPAGRAVDYDVAPGRLPRFHEIAAEVGLGSYGADSNDPGHVYFVGSEFLTPGELAVMRTLPRVTYVTLETGRPADEAAAYGHFAATQERERVFVGLPFEPLPRIEPATPRARVYAAGTHPTPLAPSTAPASPTSPATAKTPR